ncbi:MAG: hypothetical protein ACT4NY_21230 [Pseudonocardiales bacterium]
MAGPWDIVGDVASGIARGAREVAGVFDIGEPSGNDHASSNWAAWGHEEIRSMLDTSVEPGEINEVAGLWRDQGARATDMIIRLASDLNTIVSSGWRGGSADAAIASLEPIKQWSASQAQAAEQTTRLMDDSGYAAGQAKATVPPAVHHDMRQSLTTFAVGGLGAAFVDAIAQDQAQEEARREAVHIMNRVYSAPINDNRVAVPSYPQPVDPTLRPPEPSPLGGPTPGAGLPSGGSGFPHGGGEAPGGGAQYQPPAAAGLQGAGSVDGGQVGPPAGSPQAGGQGHGGGGYPGHGGQGQGVGAAAAAAVPFMPPMAGGDEQERARRGFHGAGPPGVRAGGGGGYPGGHPGSRGGGYPGGDFGPRGSNPGPAAVGEGRAGPGGVAGGRGGGGGVPPGGVPVGGPGGRGQGGEDLEHRRPSFLIEMNDIFNDGRKVAPPVIGVDLPEDHG